MSIVSVTILCPANRRTVYLRTAGAPVVEAKIFPRDRAIISTDDGDSGSQLIITPAVDMPVLITVETGRLRRRPHADVLYDGPITLTTGHLVVMDAEGTSVDPVPFLLTPGVHRVVAQASGRDKAVRTFDAFVNMPEGDVRPWQPVEHWSLTFPS